MSQFFVGGGGGGSGTVSNITYVTNATSPYTVLPADYFISVDSSAGPVTIYMPNSPTPKQVWVVKDRTGFAPTNPITITTTGGIILFDGTTSTILDDKNEAVTILADTIGGYELY